MWRLAARRPAAHRPAPSDRARDRPAPAPATRRRALPRLLARPSPAIRRAAAADVPFPARAPPLPGRQGPRPNRRAVGADSGRAPSVRADPALFTLLAPTMPPTSFDIGFSLNPCPRKLGAPHLNVAMMVRRAGMPGKATPDVLQRLARTVVGRIVAQVEAEPHPAAMEIGLMLLKLGEGAIQQIDGHRRVAEAADGESNLRPEPFDTDAGLTIQANRIPQAQAEIYLANNCLVRKYESRVTTWFGVVLDARDFATLRHAVVISYPWQPTNWRRLSTDFRPRRNCCGEERVGCEKEYAEIGKVTLQAKSLCAQGKQRHAIRGR